MTERNLPQIELEINVPVVVKPWRVRMVKTKYGDKLMLVVKDGKQESEIPWLPVDLASDLVTLKVLELGKWPDGNTKFTVLQGAPDIAICKRQGAEDKHPHYEVALADENAGPEMPTRGPVALNPTADDPVDVLADCANTAATLVLAMNRRLGIEDKDYSMETFGPQLLAASIRASASFAATLFIQRTR